MNLGFIGCGNMAKAIIKGIVKSSTIAPSDIYAFDIYEPAICKAKEELGINTCESEIEIAKACDVIILAVKPNVLLTVLNKIDDALTQDKLIISIAAGKTIDFIASNLTKDIRIIRVMPNINAMVGEAIIAYTTKNATDNDKSITEQIFASTGKVIELDEGQFAQFGVLGGCTPAFAYMFIDALARAGVKNGMKKDVALEIAAQAVLGSAKMILESDEHPYDLVDKVCSPGGTTIEGVTSLQADGFEAAVHNAVNKAIEKDSKL